MRCIRVLLCVEAPMLTPAARSSDAATANPAGPIKPSQGRRWRTLIINKRALLRLAILAVLIALPLVYCYFTMVRMPGHSHAGPLPPLTQAQAGLAQDLRATVEHLASGVGKRSTFQ